jgi:hypothetical protein
MCVLSDDVKYVYFGREAKFITSFFWFPLRSFSISPATQSLKWTARADTRVAGQSLEA